MVPREEMAQKIEIPDPPPFGATNRFLWQQNKLMRKKLEKANEKLGYFLDYIKEYKKEGADEL